MLRKTVLSNLLSGEIFPKPKIFRGDMVFPRSMLPFEDMMEQNTDGVNAVYIATPPSSHFEYVKLSLKAGIKQIYVEKPVTLDANEAKQLKAEADSHGAKLVVAHYRNSLPMFQYIHNLIIDKIVGEVRSVNIRQHRHSEGASSADGNWRIDPSISGGGLFHDIAPHTLALVQMMFGNAEDVYGLKMRQGQTDGPENLVTGLYRLPESGRALP